MSKNIVGVHVYLDKQTVVIRPFWDSSDEIKLLNEAIRALKQEIARRESGRG